MDDFFKEVGKITVKYEYLNHEIVTFLWDIFGIDYSSDDQIIIEKMYSLSSTELHSIYKQTLLKLKKDSKKKFYIPNNDLNDIFNELTSVRKERNHFIHSYCARLQGMTEVGNEENTIDFKQIGLNIFMVRNKMKYKLIKVDGITKIVNDIMCLKEKISDLNNKILESKVKLDFKVFFLFYIKSR